MDITTTPKNNQVKCDQKIRFFYDKINYVPCGIYEYFENLIWTLRKLPKKLYNLNSMEAIPKKPLLSAPKYLSNSIYPVDKTPCMY